jgi:hypothetical protein
MSDYDVAPPLDAIHDAIQATREEPLKDWAAIAIWDEGESTVLGKSSQLQLKGYLHSGLWAMAHSETTPPDRSVGRDLSAATDIRDFPKGHMHVVRVGGAAIGKATFEPGFKWSDCIGPILGRDMCPLEHVGVVLKGTLHIAMGTGDEFDVTEGEAIHLMPGHDAWTVGNEICEVLEVLSAEEYAKAPGSMG